MRFTGRFQNYYRKSTESTPNGSTPGSFLLQQQYAQHHQPVISQNHISGGFKMEVGRLGPGIPAGIPDRKGSPILTLQPPGPILNPAWPGIISRHGTDLVTVID